MGGGMHAHGVPLAHDAPERLFPPVRAVAHDKERRFDPFFFQRVQDRVCDDGARAVVECEIDAFFFLRKCERRLRKNGARAQVGCEHQQGGEKYDERNVFFLHILSLGNFYKNIYFFPRTCYNSRE